MLRHLPTVFFVLSAVTGTVSAMVPIGQQTGQGASDISFSGAEIQLAGLLLSPVVLAITGMFWLVMKAKDAQIHQMQDTKDAQIAQALNITLTLIAAKDQTIGAKDQTITSVENRCTVLDNRVIETGKAAQETAQKQGEAQRKDMATVSASLHEVLEQLQRNGVNSDEQHRAIMAGVHVTAPPEPTARAKPRAARSGA